MAISALDLILAEAALDLAGPAAATRDPDNIEWHGGIGENVDVLSAIASRCVAAAPRQAHRGDSTFSLVSRRVQADVGLFAPSELTKTQVFRQRFYLRENFFDDPPGDIGQAEVTPLKLDCQPRVIDAQQTQHRCVNIMDVDAVT